MASLEAQPAPDALRVERCVYGGDGLARTAAGEVVFVPFALPGELVERPPVGETAIGLRILEPSPARVEPKCVHFGVCGGCQYQMASYGEQLRIKEEILRETLERAGLKVVPVVRTWGSPEAYGYRNRIRLRVREVDGALRLGYSVRGSNEFLPVHMCPIAAPVLWRAAEVVMRVAVEDRPSAEWLRAAAECELVCDAGETRLQVHLLCPGTVPRQKGSFERFMQKLAAASVPVTSAGASRLHVASGRAVEALASWGADGIAYRVGEDTFWLRRGSFFQVNRFLVPEMLEVVCANRTGRLAWDLFAGVGLFTRRLARQFEAVTAVEANPVAVAELKNALRRPGDQAVDQTTLTFLGQAVLQRDRPDLVVLDPPRAGAGEEACGLLARLRPAEIVYVSCDPTTLGRDLQVLVAAGYSMVEAHVIDLFPQTYHLETVMVLRRGDVQG